jgi:hypothetical protein
MCITAASRAVLVVAGAVMALTLGVAAAKTDREAANRHCMALARLGTPPSRPSLGIMRRQATTYNECMERAGFPPGHANRK